MSSTEISLQAAIAPDIVDVLDVWATDPDCPTEIATVIEEGALPSWILTQRIRFPAIRGRTESHLHAPDLTSKEPDKACWRGGLRNARPGEHARHKPFAGECSCPTCESFFRAIREVRDGE